MIALVELRKNCSYFHWLPADLFKGLTHRHIVSIAYAYQEFTFQVIFLKFLLPYLRYLILQKLD